MSSTKAAVNSFAECNAFEEAAQFSVILSDNKLTNSNDEAFSINIQSVTVDLDTTNLFIIIKFGYNARCHWLKERAL